MWNKGVLFGMLWNHRILREHFIKIENISKIF
jgi:hypothetical protein